MKFSPYNTINDVSHHEFTLTFGHVQADMRDVAFYFRKKSGIPKLTDSGLADVLLGGQGLTVRISSDIPPLADAVAGHRPSSVCGQRQVVGVQGEEHSRESRLAQVFNP